MNKKKLITYLLTTFAITWSCWWGLALLTGAGLVQASQGVFMGLHILGGFGPTIAAISVLPKKSAKAVLHFAFSGRKNSGWYLLLFCTLQVLIIGLSSRERNPMMPWYAAPIVLLTATFLGGGNEELGWRGIMQPELEKRFSFPVATLITGGIWMLWHVPLWFVEGTSQQNMNFGLYAIYGLFLSTWLGALYKKTDSIFCCAVFHGVSNLLLSFFVIKINWILAVGLLALLAFSLRLGCYQSASDGTRA